MKLALTIVALLCAFALAIVAGLARHGRIDAAGQGVLLLDSGQAAECDQGGGCTAWSQREIQFIASRAAALAAIATAKQCKQSGA